MSEQVKERPVLFSGPMVRAILEGRKTQTRRIVKDPRWAEPDSLEIDEDGVHAVATVSGCLADVSCPYGKVGDRLYVREAWKTGSILNDKSPAEIGDSALEAGYQKPWAPIHYEADGATDNADTLADFGGEWGRYRHARFMPRWASRITLEITDIRVERLQDISEGDAISEGIMPSPKTTDNSHQFWRDYRLSGDGTFCVANPIASFKSLFESINGPDSWNANPFVWCISFQRIYL